MKYKVVTVAKDLHIYPEFREDTEKYPHLLEVLQGMSDTFVILSEDPNTWWCVADFFYAVDIREFETLEVVGASKFTIGKEGFEVKRYSNDTDQTYKDRINKRIAETGHDNITATVNKS